MNQKIAGLYPTQEYEGWFEWRRTGYPRVLIGGDGDDLDGTSPHKHAGELPWMDQPWI